MTAQAGAVAYAREHDASRPTFHDVVLPDSQEAEMWAYALVPLYAVPPAAVPVEALEGLVAKWRKGADEIAAFAETQGPTYQVEADSGINWLRNVADELTQLIKERSNG